MNNKLLLVLAIATASLTTGCIVDPYYPPPARPVVGVAVANPYYPPPAPGVAYVEGDFVAPEVIIVEGGVRHDVLFYRRHPEIYWRDRARYPQRFAHLPPPRRGPYNDPHHKKDHHDDRH